MVLQRSANRFLRQFATNYAVKDEWGLIGKKFNNLAMARKFARRMSFDQRGVTFSVWSGKGFTVSLGIRYKSGNRRGR